jgi:hypothetical protein
VRSSRLLLALLVVSLFLVASLLVPPLPRAAAATAIGDRDFSYRDANAVQTPTYDKPQSKLWFQGGSWWGLLYSTSQHATCIYRLDLSSQQWVNTGTIVDTRPTARGDALWDSQTGKLYVVSGTTVVSEYGSPPDPAAVSAGSAQLLRFSYDAASKAYSLDPGFPATVDQGSTESITIAKDSTGELWVTYTLVAPDNTSHVYVTHSVGNDTTWATPYVLPTTAASVHYDDISAIIAFQGNKIGVMWSNQLTRKFYLAVHQDGTSDSAWQTEIAYGGGVGGCSTGCANDHINLKTVQDGSGRVFAAIKTANRNTGQPFVALVVRDGMGAWSGYQFGAVEDVHTRPMVMIDEEHREIFMFAVSPEVGGTIYYKKSPLDNISFAPGLGTPFMQSDVDTDISNPASTKQSLNGQTGLVVLASANTSAYYWHNYMSLSSEPAPPPAAPTDLAVSSPTTNADSTAQLSWSDNSTDEDGFAIERKTGTNAYAQVATIASNATSYTDTGLAAATTYTYRVRASNSVGYSLYSNEASVTTAQVGPTRTFTPIADAYVDSGVPNTNYGTKTTNLSVDASPVQESYLKFQLASLTGNTITSAKLRLYVSDNGSVKGGSVAKMSNTSWTETGVTYNNRPTIDGATLSTLGAVNIGSWYEFNVTSAVTGDGTISLGLKTSSTDGVHYSSREDTTHAPQLVVTVTPGDTTAPETTIDSGPSGTVATSSASLAFSSNESVSTFECSLDGAPFAACASPQAYSGLTQGSHSFQVRATDGSGNTDPTPASRSWTVDTVPPATQITSSPPDPSNSTSPSFSFTSDDLGATYECSLDGSTWAACTSPKAYTGLADGSHTFLVRGRDAVGNVDLAPPMLAWTIDTVPPDTTITTGPQGTATSDSATFTFTSAETPSTFECSLDGAPFAACTSPTSYSGLANGSHTFSVRATDAAGNLDGTPATRTWTVDVAIVDTTPPTVSLTSPAAGTSTVRGTLQLSADASDDVAVDHVDFLVNGTVIGTAGSAPYTVGWNSATIADGAATIAARAVDTSDNATTSADRTVTVDNTPPDTTVDSGPSGTVGAAMASFAFSSNESATFECSLDGSAFSGCASPQSYSGLADGTHTFQVRATDSAGNVDATPATRSWTVDTASPDTSITGGPTGTVNSRSTTFSFTATETSVTFACSVDGSAYTDCSSPATYAGMSDGAHTFQVRATDAAGNVDATPASRTWTVDPVLFSDGFESGNLSRWTQVRVAGSGAVANAQSSVVKSGNFSAYITAPTTDNYAYARATLAASQTDLTVSGDFDITVEGVSGQEVPIFKLYDGAGSRLVYVYRRNVSGSIYVVYNGTTYYTATKMALGTWTNFVVHTITAGASSTVEVTMNGKSIYRTTTASLGTSGIRTIQIGNDKQLPFALYADNILARI